MQTSEATNKPHHRKYNKMKEIEKVYVAAHQ